MPAPRRRWTAVVLVALLAVMINLPTLHGLLLDRRLDDAGVTRTAEVEDLRVSGDTHLLEYDLDGTVHLTRVDPATYAVAERTGTVEVTLLADDPTVHRVQGEVGSRVGLTVTLVADAALGLMLLLLWSFRSRLRPDLRLVATRDVERCPPGASLRTDGETYVVCGEVLEIGVGELVLDLGDRRVQVLLDGHLNPVRHQQPARVTGRVLG